MMQDSIRIFLVFAQFFRSDFLRLTIFCLQLNQPQTHTSNTSLVEAFHCQLMAERFSRLTYVGECIHCIDNDLLQEYYVRKKSTKRMGVSQQGLQTLKNSCILSLKNFFLASAPLRVVEQSISSSIGLALVIIDAEIAVGQLLSSEDLARAQTFYIHELTQVVIIGQNQDLVLVAFQVVAPILKHFNNS